MPEVSVLPEFHGVDQEIDLSFLLGPGHEKRKFFAFPVQYPWLDHDVLQEVVRDGLIEPFVLRAVPDQDAERLDHGFDGVIRHVLRNGLPLGLASGRPETGHREWRALPGLPSQARRKPRSTVRERAFLSCGATFVLVFRDHTEMLSILAISSGESSTRSMSKSSFMCCASVVPVKGSMPTCWAKRKMTCAGPVLHRLAMAPTSGS